jgi:hypothetical protein
MEAAWIRSADVLPDYVTDSPAQEPQTSHLTLISGVEAPERESKC